MNVCKAEAEAEAAEEEAEDEALQPTAWPFHTWSQSDTGDTAHTLPPQRRQPR